MPNLRNLLLGLWERTEIFLARVGTIILTLMVVLWFLASFPAPPAGATGPPIQYSIAGMLGRGLRVHLRADRLQLADLDRAGAGTRGARGGGGRARHRVRDVRERAPRTWPARCTPIIAHSWRLATGLSLLAWYVFAPQCLSTLAVVKRETNSWRYPLIMAAYLFALAYLASFVTYRVALLLGAGVIA